MTLCVNEDGTIMRAASRLVDAVELLKPDRKESNVKQTKEHARIVKRWKNAKEIAMFLAVPKRKRTLAHGKPSSK